LMQAKPKDIAEFVNQQVLSHLKKRGAVPKELHPPRIMLPERIAKVYEADGFSERYSLLLGRVDVIYHEYDIQYEVADEVARQVAHETGKRFSVEESTVNTSPDAMDQLESAFTETRYIGHAHIAFEKYLRRCWKAYNSAQFKAPCVAVVQSSGFGKSRMLLELARKANDPSSCIKVLYTCVRQYESTGFPAATEELRDWLFLKPKSVEQMARRLEAVYEHALANWDGVQAEWTKLFTKSDDAVTKALKRLKTEQRPLKPLGERVQMRREAEGKVVVLVVDEARNLLGRNGRVDRLRMLREALTVVNDAVGGKGGVFGVLVDTSCKITDPTPSGWSPSPSLQWDSSSRDSSGTPQASFSPFVLTHTMDAHWGEYCEQVTAKAAGAGKEEAKEDAAMGSDHAESQMQGPTSAEIAVYKAVVTGEEDAAWAALKSMGRPMWRNAPNAVDLAANKLMLGKPPGAATYTEENLFGVAAMLCRLGVRPTATLASRVVADFMAVLAYVFFENEGCLSSYASDPVLSLGAEEVWHALPSSLEEFLLPQLTKLVLSETLDTGGIDSMVARIVLLLAMDACTLQMPGECVSKGQFVTVDAFLSVLEGGEAPTYRSGTNRQEDDEPAWRGWREQWQDWRMRFTHFVQLELEPNEDTLWCLLGRRAAGILPRCNDGFDLLVPMFWRADKPGQRSAEVKARVSLLLIQVGGGSFEASAVSQAREWPSRHGADEVESSQARTLRQRSRRERIRIVMDLRDGACTASRGGQADACVRFVERSSVKDDRPAETEESEFAYWFRSLGCKTYPFLQEDVAESLVSLLQCLRRPKALVDGDLGRRRAAEERAKVAVAQAAVSNVMPDEELRAMAAICLAFTPGSSSSTREGEGCKVGPDGAPSKKRLQTDQGGAADKRVQL
jgi:hypothetical protein